jgi:hypothetical protein
VAAGKPALLTIELARVISGIGNAQIVDLSSRPR